VSDSIGYCDMCRFSTPIEVERAFEEDLPFSVNSVGWVLKPTTIMVCRRYPPQTTGTNESSVFPEVNRLTWCGEFSPKRKIGEEPNAKVSS
jgi:hypothetical protein